MSVFSSCWFLVDDDAYEKWKLVGLPDLLLTEPKKKGMSSLTLD
jgi:hypothetical protein